MLAGPAPSTFLALEGGLDDKLHPLILFWTFAYLSWSLGLSTLHDVFCMPNLSTSRGSFLISCLHTRMKVKEKWPGMCWYMTSLPCLMRKMGVLMNRPVYCLHTHFANPHISGFAAYPLTMCTHFSTSMISLNILSIILIQNIFTKNCYNNGRLHMNRLWTFCNASMICSFKLGKAIWNFLIFGIDSSIVLTN